MPNVKLENINEATFWGLWKIEENADFLIRQVTLSADEEEELKKISNVKRKKEWLGARAILKLLMANSENGFTGLRKDKYDKPHFLDIPYQVSLAHCYPYAAALVNQKFSCGIDIERPKPALFHVYKKFLNEAELEYIPKEADYLCLSWAAKEVLYKIHGKRYLSFQKHMQLYPFAIQNTGILKAKIKISDFEQNYELNYLFIEDILICHSI